MNFDTSYDLVTTVTRQRQERLEQHAEQIRLQRRTRQLRSIAWYRRQQPHAPTDAA